MSTGRARRRPRGARRPPYRRGSSYAGVPARGRRVRPADESAPLKPSAVAGFTQSATEGDFRRWSCAIGAGDDDSDGLVHFTVTQEPPLVERHRADNEDRSALLTCAGTPTLVQVGHFFGQKERPGRTGLRPDADLLTDLTDAVADQAGCERA
ncbi:hypothetical protein [Streptomyces sp. NPDC101178]|uniref:hypothetical protein n=1 Tax=Streptomyces sp. NPDC101178 TaxID=3366124 RepID=UPI003809D2D6